MNSQSVSSSESDNLLFIVEFIDWVRKMKSYNTAQAVDFYKNSPLISSSCQCITAEKLVQLGRFEDIKSYQSYYIRQRHLTVRGYLRITLSES